MDNDFKRLVEKYKSDLIKFSSAHPQPSSATESAPAAPSSPESKPLQPRPPVILPGPKPEMPASPQPTTEMPSEPTATPEMPGTSMPEPEIAPRTSPAPEISGAAESPEQTEQGGSESGRPMSDKAMLQIRTSTARDAAPVGGAHVEVTRDGKLIYQLITDENGNTPIVELDTVSRELSTESGNASPYTTYDVHVRADGFFPVFSKNIPMFGGITTVQDIKLIPIPEFGNPDRTNQVDNTEPNL